MFWISYQIAQGQKILSEIPLIFGRVIINKGFVSGTEPAMRISLWLSERSLECFNYWEHQECHHRSFPRLNITRDTHAGQQFEALR